MKELKDLRSRLYQKFMTAISQAEDDLLTMKEEYTCENCHKTYTKGWSDEEANKEALSVFGVEEASTHGGMAVVCDDCYIKMTGIIST